jgi:hypothetical protein
VLLKHKAFRLFKIYHQSQNSQTMFKKTLIFCFCLAFSAFAKATTSVSPQRDTFISAIILLRNGDTLKVCDAKNGEKDIEFRYCDSPKRVKVISKNNVLRVVIGNNDLIYENPILTKGQVVKPKLRIFQPFWGMVEFMIGEREVNPYAFEKELVPNVKAGEARREAIHQLLKKAQNISAWSMGVLFMGLVTGLLSPVFIFIGLVISLVLSIISATTIGTANKRYHDMVDDYNAAQGYRVD